MLYTLLKFLGWGVLLGFVGGCIGWALRALKCRADLAAARPATVDDEVERMRERLADLDQVVAERDRLRMQVADMRHSDSPGVVGATAASAPEPASEASAASSDLDLDTATAAIGRPIRIDDLTVVEGIGPRIGELCNRIGITTWRGLAEADVAELRSMLTDAGSRYRRHDPTTWPEQAACLADGRWADFVALTDGFAGDR